MMTFPERPVAVHRALVRRGDGAWRVEIVGPDGRHVGATNVSKLLDVRSAAMGITGCSNLCGRGRLAVQVAVPDVTGDRLRVAEQLCADAVWEIEGAIGDLAMCGWPMSDIDWVVRDRLGQLDFAASGVMRLTDTEAR